MYHCIYIMLAMCMNGVHRCGAAACVSAAFVFASLPAMALYRAYGHISLGWNVLLHGGCRLLLRERTLCADHHCSFSRPWQPQLRCRC